MRGDDRLMTILTGVVLTVALGAVAQRGEIFGNLGVGPGFDPRDDVVAAAADGAYLIDVTANDRGATREDGRRVLILAAPGCGVAYRRDGQVLYDGAGCIGPQRLSYCVAQGDDCRGAELTILLREGEDAAMAAPSSVSDTPVTRLAEAPSHEWLASVSATPSRGGFSDAPERRADERPLAGLTSALGSLAPDAGTEVSGTDEGMAEARPNAD